MSKNHGKNSANGSYTEYLYNYSEIKEKSKHKEVAG